MLGPVEGEALLTIWEGNHVEEHDTLEAEFRGHPTRSVVADGASKADAGPLDQLTELTGKASVVVTLKGRDNFTSEYRYDVSVRNHTSDLLIADSLVIVLDKITNLAGEDREGLTGESFLIRFEVLGQDGETARWQTVFSAFQLGPTPDLGPLTDSLPATVRLRNKDYLSVFTPSFRVLGQKRPPPEPKQAQAAPVQPGATQTAPSRNSIDKLIQLLIKKGVVTEEEWRKANQP